jgi:hypothetical protein
MEQASLSGWRAVFRQFRCKSLQIVLILTTLLAALMLSNLTRGAIRFRPTHEGSGRFPSGGTALV